MTKLIKIGIFIVFICNLICCNQNQIAKNDYFVISRDGFFNHAIFKDYDTIKSKKDLIPAPPPPPGLDWYANLVIIFDSTDYVYIYQTKYLTNKNSEVEIEPKFPSFLDLKPYQLIRFKSDRFIDFIIDNNDIFQLDTIKNERHRYFIAASSSDTIKNKAYYKLIDIVRSWKKTYGRVIFINRILTEEEKYVLKCKKENKTYNATDYKWTTKYLNGDVRPLTDKYDSIEHKCYFYRKSFDVFQNKLTIMPIIE